MLGAREIEIFTQDFQQSLVGSEHDLGFFTVQREFNVGFLFGSVKQYSQLLS